MQGYGSIYIDDIIVDEDIVTVEKVEQHLLKYGLKCKQAEKLDKARVLGLQDFVDDGTLKWKHGNIVPDSTDRVFRRELFSIYGTLVGHFPVVEWLRIVTSYLKRHCDVFKWGDWIGERVEKLLKDVLAEVGRCDPVGGSCL